MNDPNSPLQRKRNPLIGVFDSGVGGLALLTKLRGARPGYRKEEGPSGLRRWYRSAGDGCWYTPLGRWWVGRLVFQALEPQELERLLALPPRGAFSVCPRHLASPKRRLRYHPPASGVRHKGVIPQDMFADKFWSGFEEAYGEALADALTA